MHVILVVIGLYMNLVYRIYLCNSKLTIFTIVMLFTNGTHVG